MTTSGNVSDVPTDQAARWCGAEYRGQSAHHRLTDDWFLTRHRPAPDAYVVDVGCGTGEFTARLAELVPDGEVVGVEPDPSMLAAARSHQRSNLRFAAGRAQELDLAVPPGSADLVVSRAALHWVPFGELPRCLAAMWRVLRPGGWLHTESGGAGNIRRVFEVLDGVAVSLGLPPARLAFLDAGTAHDLVAAAGFAVPDGGVLTVAQRRGFDREQLLGNLLTQVAHAYLAEADAETAGRFRQAVTRAVDQLANRDGSYDQTYVRVDILAQRPESLHCDGVV